MEGARLVPFSHLRPRTRRVIETFAFQLEQFRSDEWPLEHIPRLCGRGEFSEWRRQRWLSLALRAKAGEIKAVEHVPDLAQFTRLDLLAQLGFGRKALKDVSELLAGLGLELRP